MAHHEIFLIIHDAQKVIDCVSRTLKASSPRARPSQNLNSSPATHLVRKLSLPCAEHYLALIQHQDLPTDVVERCHGLLHDLARKTHETYDRTVSETTSSSPPGVELARTIDAFRRAIENRYHQRSVQLMELVDKYRTKQFEHDHVTKSSKPTFNHKYTPLLEQYFESNAYPSGSERASIAERTGMTQRQIDVWFQNHRTRAKRDGRPLRRHDGTSTLLISNILDTNNAISPQQGCSPETASDTEESDSDSQVLVSDNKERRHTILDNSPSPTPPYAFPAPYRQRDKQNPIIILPVNWERTCSTHKGQHVSMDMDKLISMFSSKLALGTRDPNVPRRRKAERGANDYRKDSWFESRRTIPATAPLPALIRSRTPKLENPGRRLAVQWCSHPYGARTSIRGLGASLEPCHRLRPVVKNNQRRRSSSSSTSSCSSLGSGDDTSSGNELLTPPASPLIPPQFLAEKAIPFDLFGWGSDSS